MYGVTQEGYSVCCHIHGFSPYFYVSLPEKCTYAHCGDLKTALNKAIMADMRSNKQDIIEPVLKVDLVQKLNIYGYHGENKTQFAKIVVAIPRYVYIFT